MAAMHQARTTHDRPEKKPVFAFEGTRPPRPLYLEACGIHDDCIRQHEGDGENKHSPMVVRVDPRGIRHGFSKYGGVAFRCDHSLRMTVEGGGIPCKRFESLVGRMEWCLRRSDEDSDIRGFSSPYTSARAISSCMEIAAGIMRYGASPECPRRQKGTGNWTG